MFKCIFLNENVWFPIKISLKFVPKGLINNILTLVQIMAGRRPGGKPLSEPMMVRLPTHICVSRPQWVNSPWFCGSGNRCIHDWTTKGANIYKTKWYGCVYMKPLTTYSGNIEAFVHIHARVVYVTIANNYLIYSNKRVSQITVPERKFVTKILVRYQGPRWRRQQPIRMTKILVTSPRDLGPR